MDNSFVSCACSTEVHPDSNPQPNLLCRKSSCRLKGLLVRRSRKSFWYALRGLFPREKKVTNLEQKPEEARPSEVATPHDEETDNPS